MAKPVRPVEVAERYSIRRHFFSISTLSNAALTRSVLLHFRTSRVAQLPRFMFCTPRTELDCPRSIHWSRIQSIAFLGLASRH